VKDWLWAWGSSGERRDGALGPVEAGSVDCQPVVEGKARVAAARIGGCGVLLQLCDERSERVREAPQEREHLFRREQVFHHHEAHEVQAEVTRGRGGVYRDAQPADMGCLAGLGRPVDAALPG
jgi:hypothetical protein